MYVGITSRKPETRWANGRGYQRGLPVRNAIEKYGWENVEKEIVASRLTSDEAGNFEKLLIKNLQLTDRQYGYNIDSGGYGRSGFKMPEETKEKLRKCMAGKHQGKDNPFYGKKHTPES